MTTTLRLVESQRDQRRVFTKAQQRDKVAEQRNNCPNCGNSIDENTSESHHIVRHADGGGTDSENQVQLCPGCHKDVHAKQSMLQTIKRNIKDYGFHVYHIVGGPTPRYSYSIGLRELVGAEVVLAGRGTFEGDAFIRIMDRVCRRLLGDARNSRVVEDLALGIYGVDGVGTFTLRKAHDSWVRVMLLGALDYYGAPTIPAFQIVPEEKHQTIEVPSLNRPRREHCDPGWDWLDEPWPYTVAKDSLALVNLLALRGKRIQEAVRSEDGWFLYASQEEPVADEDLRLVPLGFLLKFDPSLEPVIDLGVGQALWRGDDSGWESWDD